MSKNFISFLRAKNLKNEGFVDFLKSLVGDIDLPAEEQKFIYQINQSFKKYTNNLIGMKHHNNIVNNFYPITKEKAYSIYRNLKNGLTEVLKNSYKRVKLNNEDFKFKLEERIESEEEKTIGREEILRHYASEIQNKWKKPSEDPFSTKIINVAPEDKNNLGVISGIAKPERDQEFAATSSIIRPTPDKEFAANQINVFGKPEELKEPEKIETPKKPAEPDIPVMGGVTNFQFIRNLNKLILNVKKYFADSKERLPIEKPIFNTLELISRLYTYSEVPDDPRQRFKKHISNITYLENENWKLIVSKIIEAFEKNQCDFKDNEFTKNVIQTFKNIASRFEPVEINYSGFTGALKKNVNWKNISASLFAINKFIDEFCAKNPELCAKTGRGSAKLLDKLAENKKFSFYNWLLIKENKLF